MIDLRSDTVTLPTKGMRDAMVAAELGDDVYGEDPSINRLEDRSAEITGKESALFVASGTMANLLAVLTHASPGDSVIMGEGAHSFMFETGALSAIGGAMPVIVGSGGTFKWCDVEHHSMGGNIHFASTSLVMMENTHNQGGGIIFPREDVEEITRHSCFWGLKTHIDGARIFNASVAVGSPVRELAGGADSICFCLSKGLGAPVGSVLCGSNDFIDEARRYRKMLGGGMRQAGVLAAAGLYALSNNVERLQEDHDNARLLGEKLSELDDLEVDLSRVQTNMVYANVKKPGLNALEYGGRLKEKGLLVNAMSRDYFRAVLHLGIEKSHVLEAMEVFKKCL